MDGEEKEKRQILGAAHSGIEGGGGEVDATQVGREFKLHDKVTKADGG